MEKKLKELFPDGFIEIPINENQSYDLERLTWDNVKHFDSKITADKFIGAFLHYIQIQKRDGKEKDSLQLLNLVIGIVKAELKDPFSNDNTVNEYFLAKLKALKRFIKYDTPEPAANQKPTISKIWLSEPKITVDEFLNKGIEKGIWDNKYKIIVKRGSLYGTGKSLLGNLSIALKGYAISDNTDYKEVGKEFCETFNISINDTIQEPYKCFSSGNGKKIVALKRAFNIK